MKYPALTAAAAWAVTTATVAVAASWGLGLKPHHALVVGAGAGLAAFCYVAWRALTSIHIGTGVDREED